MMSNAFKFGRLNEACFPSELLHSGESEVVASPLVYTLSLDDARFPSKILHSVVSEVVASPLYTLSPVSCLLFSAFTSLDFLYQALLFIFGIEILVLGSGSSILYSRSFNSAEKERGHLYSALAIFLYISIRFVSWKGR
uniref:Uncharacterized protein n=1 Tax=Oryza nivara TaxID=4536 RepID=A0A0E0G1M3_ORYNI